MRAQFVASEIWIGLRRNLTMTLAVIVTAAISLTMFGVALMVRNQVNVMKGFWYGKVEVSIFLKSDVTQDQRDQLLADLNAMPEVQRVFFESKQDAYKRFKEQFKDSPEIVANATPDVLPESFRVKLKDPRKFEVVNSAFADRPGVENVLNQRELLRNFFTVLNTFGFVMIVFAGISLAAAVVLIGITVRVAAFSRRRETGIMRLVGASNLYIQMPFIMEGAIAGLIGGLFSAVLLVIAKVALIDRLQGSIQFASQLGWGTVAEVIIAAISLGMLLCAGSSFLTLRRYLRI